MTIYRAVGGVNREIKKQFHGVGGVNREVTEQYRGVSGVNRQVFNTNKDLIKPPYPSDLTVYVPMSDKLGLPTVKVGGFELSSSTPIPTAIEGYQGNIARYIANTQYFRIPKAYLPTSRFSLRTLIKMDATSDLGYILWSGREGSNAYGINVRVNGTSGLTVELSDTASLVAYTTVAGNLRDGVWHDILITWDGTTTANGIKIYTDKVLKAQLTANFTKITHYDVGGIGVKSNGDPSSYARFNGVIAELAIYNTVKTPSDF